MTTDLKPRWMRELERLASHKSQIYLYGNIRDTVLYPLGPEENPWTLGPLRESLFELFRHQIGGYELIGAYNQVDGLVFADMRENNTMAKLFDELVETGEKNAPPPAKGRAPQPAKTANPLDQAFQQMRLAVSNRQHPCVFLIENASQLIGAPVNLQPAERISFLRLMKSSAESQLVAVENGGEKRALQNLIILCCDKLTDMPAWLYFTNPFTGSVEIEHPRSYERRHFFDLFFTLGRDRGMRVDDLVDLTEGMTMRDLSGIRALARKNDARELSAKRLVDSFKYGARESEWDNLPWAHLERAESKLAERVIGQPAAVSAVADVLRRARLALSGAQHSSRTKPRGVLFFAGPTGVGKTELAKAVSELVFGTEDACVRFDMSEFSQPHADQRLLGAPPGYVGYEEGGQLTNRMKSNPFAVLLFDEIEKAHPSIMDKFLQILEDGRMTDGRGETVYFAESIIIFTSNVGIYQLDPQTGHPMVDPLTNQPLLHVDPAIHKEYSSVQARVLEGVGAYFKHILGRPELLNRIGQNIIVFDFIRPAVMREIMERKVLRSIQAQVRQRWQLEVQFAPEVLDELMVIAGLDPGSGGRGMGNLAEAAILNPLARALFKLLSAGEHPEGKTLVVTGIILPQESAEFRYEIIWHIEQPDGTVEDAEETEKEPGEEDSVTTEA